MAVQGRRKAKERSGVFTKHLEIGVVKPW